MKPATPRKTLSKRPSNAKRERADLLLVEQGLAETRAKAQALILAGRVYAGEQRIDKAGVGLPRDTRLQVNAGERYVSRGGHKLAGALVDLGVDPKEKICADVGASTGGFTDCLLQHGARKVYAVDVGQGLLATKLSSDPRVVVMDRTNARRLDAASFSEAVELLVVDVSFIGIGKVLPALALVLTPGTELLAMLKPQFEVGKEAARRARGVIKDAAERQAAIDAALLQIAEAGFTLLGTVDSRLPGPKGNVEHFIRARRN